MPPRDAFPDEERPTEVQCPACNGEGMVVTHPTSTTHKGGSCELCEGLGIVTVSKMREWKIAQAIASRAST